MDFNSKFHLEEVKHEELISLLLSHFGHLSSERLPGEYIFEKRDNPQNKLIVGITKNGKVSFVKGVNITKEEYDEIEQSIIKNLIENQDIKIAQSVLFSINLKINGAFKYKDLFQVLPIPPDAPNIDHIAGEHPFILQYKYSSSANVLIDNSRKKSCEIYIARLLSFFTRGYIKHSSFFTSFSWIYEKEFVEGNIVSRYAQHGYSWKDIGSIVDSFNDIEGFVKIDTVAPENYYKYLPDNQTEDCSLLLPSNLSYLFDKVNALKGEYKQSFERACNWYYQSKEIWGQSQSSAFIASVTALECLFEKLETCPECGSPNEEKLETCNSCGQPKFKITKTLREFLGKYVPFIGEMKRERNLIYKVRSDLAHGLDMLSRDIEPGLFIKPIQQEQDQLQRNINYIVYIGMYNWLVSH
jgi:hypothetical protein